MTTIITDRLSEAATAREAFEVSGTGEGSLA